MNKIITVLLLMMVSNSWACDPTTGERQQQVFAGLNGKALGNWTVNSAETKQFELDNGYKLGILIKEAEPEKYSEVSQVWPHVPELVSIELFDMATEPPTRVSRTWGGANSMQGFGSRGGANVVEELGNPGLSLHLVKAVCIDN